MPIDKRVLAGLVGRSARRQAAKLGLVLRKRWTDKKFLRRPKETIAALTADEYQYAALPTPSSIRILSIEEGAESDVIRCALRTVDLDDEPDYTAVSYSWLKDKSLARLAVRCVKGGLRAFSFVLYHGQLKGRLKGESTERMEQRLDAAEVYKNSKRLTAASRREKKQLTGQTRTIILNGQQFRVLPNLYDALLQLRRSRPGDYWIDAVCINQLDLEERASQVQMMGQVYRGAGEVLVWLGQCPTVLSPGLARLNKLIEEAAGDETDTFRPRPRPRPPPQPPLLLPGAAPRPPPATWPVCTSHGGGIPSQSSLPGPIEAVRVESRGAMTSCEPRESAPAAPHITSWPAHDSTSSGGSTSHPRVLPERAPGGASLASKGSTLSMVLAATYAFSRRWFRRLWVLQEASLARRTIFMHGGCCLDAEVVLATLHMLRAAVTVMADGEGASALNLASLRGSCNMMLSLFGTFIVDLHKTLEHRGFFRHGGLWTLERWLLICKNRRASNARDYVYAALSLVQPETLRIDQGLQLEPPAGPEEDSSDVPRAPGSSPRRLWPVLDANYKADEAEVFFNLAACLLSQPHGIGSLFGCVAAFGDLYTREWSPFQRARTSVPSWVPLPLMTATMRTWPMAEPGMAIEADSLFPAVDGLFEQYPGARISHDGTTLFASAVRLATISDHIRASHLLGSDVFDMIKFVEWAAEVVPLRLGGGDGVAALASALVGGRWKGRPVRPSNTEDLVAQFCGYVGERVSNALRLCHRAHTQAVHLMAPWMDAPRGPARLTAAYRRLAAALPGAPWPDMAARRSSSGPGGQHGGRVVVVVAAPPAETGFAGYMVPAVNWMDVFVTPDGRAGLGPASVQAGDAVMLVAGGRVPYVLAEEAAAARRRAGKLQDCLEKTLAGKARPVLEGQLRELHGEMRGMTGWRFVGEAYLGVSPSEQQWRDMGGRVERISIV